MKGQPTFLYWVLPGVIAGMSMPFLHPERRMHGGGGLHEFDDELAVLAVAGIGAVVSLLNIPTDAKLYSDAGFEFVCLPIADGQPPSLDQVKELVRFVDSCRSTGKAVAVHCEAGCGRTGTMLCAYLIAKGETPERAIESVRAVEPSAVETRGQIDFLSRLPSTLLESTSTLK